MLILKAKNSKDKYKRDARGRFAPKQGTPGVKPGSLEDQAASAARDTTRRRIGLHRAKKKGKSELTIKRMEQSLAESKLKAKELKQRVEEKGKVKITSGGKVVPVKPKPKPEKPKVQGPPKNPPKFYDHFKGKNEAANEHHNANLLAKEKAQKARSSINDKIAKMQSDMTPEQMLENEKVLMSMAGKEARANMELSDVSRANQRAGLKPSKQSVGGLDTADPRNTRDNIMSLDAAMQSNLNDVSSLRQMAMGSADRFAESKERLREAKDRMEAHGKPPTPKDKAEYLQAVRAHAHTSSNRNEYYKRLSQAKKRTGMDDVPGDRKVNMKKETTEKDGEYTIKTGGQEKVLEKSVVGWITTLHGTLSDGENTVQIRKIDMGDNYVRFQATFNPAGHDKDDVVGNNSSHYRPTMAEAVESGKEMLNKWKGYTPPKSVTTLEVKQSADDVIKSGVLDAKPPSAKQSDVSFRLSDGTEIKGKGFEYDGIVVHRGFDSETGEQDKSGAWVVAAKDGSVITRYDRKRDAMAVAHAISKVANFNEAPLKLQKKEDVFRAAQEVKKVIDAHKKG